MAVFESFPDSVLLRILLSVLLHIVSFSWSCYVLYPSLSLVTYRIFFQPCYILYPFLSLVTYCIIFSVLLHISYLSLSLVTYCILLSVLLHIVWFSQSCYTSYPSLSLVTYCIHFFPWVYFSLLYEGVTCKTNKKIMDSSRCEGFHLQAALGTWEWPRVSSSSSLDRPHLRLQAAWGGGPEGWQWWTLHQSLGISSHGPEASPWSFITSWISEHLIVLCPSSVLRHLVAHRHLLGPSSLHGSVNTSLAFFRSPWTPQSPCTSEDYWLLHSSPNTTLSVVLTVHHTVLEHLRLVYVSDTDCRPQNGTTDITIICNF